MNSHSQPWNLYIDRLELPVKKDLDYCMYRNSQGLKSKMLFTLLEKAILRTN